jgi:hypothetical protein
MLFKYHVDVITEYGADVSLMTFSVLLRVLIW